MLCKPSGSETQKTGLMITVKLSIDKEFCTNTANGMAPSREPLQSDEFGDAASLKDICETEQATRYLRD